MEKGGQGSAPYKLVSYRTVEGPRAGIVVDGSVFNVAEVIGKPSYATMLDILNDWEVCSPLLESGASPTKAARSGLSIEKAELLAPVLYPPAIFCAGANYSDHAREMAEVLKITAEPDPRSIGLNPWHFLKASRAVVGTNATVNLPAHAQMIDWEAELAAVIGRAAKNVPVESALDYVAGYTVANDLSARDFTSRPNVAPTSPFRYDWVSQKSFDGSCPLGPWIVPAKYIPNPQNLGIKLWVNDVVKQDSHTSRMIFPLREQIAYLSTRITLHPGDLILTGTPAGVGMARREFLKSGDVVRVWVEGVGTLTNKMS